MDERSETEQTAMRRAPRQARGQQRVAAILDAAAALFAEVGYEAATTNTIASRAGVPIGSIYQFFANKSAILYALTLRYLDEMRGLHTATLGPASFEQPPEQTIGRFVDALVDFQHSHRGFGAILSIAKQSEGVAPATEELHHVLIDRVEALLGAYVPQLTPAQRSRHALITIYAVKGLMPLLESTNDDLRAAIVAELKSLLLAYLESMRERAG